MADGPNLHDPLNRRLLEEIWPMWLDLLAEHEHYIGYSNHGAAHGQRVERKVRELSTALLDLLEEAVKTPREDNLLSVVIGMQRQMARILESIAVEDLRASASAHPETEPEKRAKWLGLLLERMRSEARERLTQEGMAHRLGVSRQMVNHLERGRNAPTIERLFEWAKITGHDIIIEAYSRSSPTHQAVRVISALLMAMPIGALAVVVDVVRAWPHLPDNEQTKLQNYAAQLSRTYHPSKTSYESPVSTAAKKK